MNGMKEENNADAKVETGVYHASLLAGVAGFIWLYMASKPVETED